MKTFIISMILFAVVVAYVDLRSPANKTESDMPAVAAKGKTENAEYSAVAAYRKPRKASESDWAVVRAIAQEYAEKIGNIVALRENLKASEYYGRLGGKVCGSAVMNSSQGVMKSTLPSRELLGKCAT